MDLRTGPAYWFLKNGLMRSYPPLEEDAVCEVAIIGGGITGALLGYQFAKQGIDTVLLDKHDIVSGSTSASTSLLQYEIDTELLDLIRVVGEADAVRSYRLGLEAIAKIETLVREIGDDCEFAYRPSLYLASKSSQVKKLKAEYECRREFGFDVEYWEPEALKSDFGLDAPAAILSRGDAMLDGYRFAHRLLEKAQHHGLRVFDRTLAAQIENVDSNISITTDRDAKVAARKVVFATGYESQSYLKQKIGSLHSTFALISEPMRNIPQTAANHLIWETARPYFYLRPTFDDRLIIGGEDVPFATAHKQTSLIERKKVKLLDRFHKLFPNSKFEDAFAWAGTFGETADGLAYIGESPEWPNAYFALGYGGNGITMSMIAADLITNDYLGRPNPDLRIFRFER